MTSTTTAAIAATATIIARIEAKVGPLSTADLAVITARIASYGGPIDAFGRVRGTTISNMIAYAVRAAR